LDTVRSLQSAGNASEYYTKPMKLEHFAPVAEWWNKRKEIQADGFDKAKKYATDYGYTNG